MLYLPNSPPDGLHRDEQRPGSITIPLRLTAASSSEPESTCRCRCGGCSCATCTANRRAIIPNPNRETYGGQGTSFDSLLEDAAFITAHSFEARQPNDVMVAPPSLDLISKRDEPGSAQQLARERTEQYLQDIDNNPWPYFVSSPSIPSDATEPSGPFFGPMDMDSADDDSMENHLVSSGSYRSMLSSYASAMSCRSQAASAVIKHAGAALTAAAAASAAASATRSDPNDQQQLLIDSYRSDK